MNTIQNILHIDDKELIEGILSTTESANERLFFETLRFRQENVFTAANDLLLSERDNEDQIYLVRIYFDEYEIGHCSQEGYDAEYHAMNLSEAMAVNLSHLGYIDRDMTLLDWLRARDYKGIRYDRNFDEI